MFNVSSFINFGGGDIFYLRNMIIVETKEVSLNSFSVPGYDLPTFSRGILKTVYKKNCFMKRIIHKRLFFTYVATIYGWRHGKNAATMNEFDEFQYVKTWIKVK